MLNRAARALELALRNNAPAATKKSYELLLRMHLLPRFRDSRLCTTTGALARQRQKPAAELPLPSAVVQALLTHRSRSSDGILYFQRHTTRFEQSAQTAVASGVFARRVCADQLAHPETHAHGTLLHEQGTPLRLAQAQLGHSTTTAQRRAVEQLENQSFPSVPEFQEITGRPN